VPGTHLIAEVAARLPKTKAALAYAERQHGGQRRIVDGAPFMLHPIEVASLLYLVGAPDHVIAAGLLHDTIEKTSTDAGALRKQFGERISQLVVAVSEDEALSDRGYQARKAALRRQVAVAGDEALMIFAADKISKARELDLARTQAGGARPSGRERGRKLTQYRHCLALLEHRLEGSPLVSQLRAELEHLAEPHVVPAPAPAAVA
jgi:guanosine-3',5'-bis(diphosphate) 3'-pyrophosphohydrolase